jgi:hypothetical protein
VDLEFVAVTVAQPPRIFTGFPDIELRWAEILPPFQRTLPFYAEYIFFQAKFLPRGKLASKRWHLHNVASNFL